MLEAQERDGALARNRWRGVAADTFPFRRLGNLGRFGHRTISPQRSRISSEDQRSPLFGATPSVIAILNAES